MGTIQGHISGMVICLGVIGAGVGIKVLVGMWSHIYRAYTEEKGRQ